MSPDQHLPAPAIDDEWLTSALHAGALDDCLARLSAAGGVGWLAGLNCRLAEALFHRGRHAEAVECCRRALPYAGADCAALRVCAWVFSNCGCHGEAAAAYGRLLALMPNWIEGYRHRSGALAMLGRLDEAARDGVKASDGLPEDAGFALHAGSLLAAAGRREEAARYLRRAVAGSPDDSSVAADAAELLMRCGLPDEAAAMLEAVAARCVDPRLLRVLSAAEMLVGRIDEALAAIGQAIAAAPQVAEYHVHRAHLLLRLGRADAAGAALDLAAAVDPASRELAQARLQLCLAGGLVSEATALGGELLHRFPDDRGTAETVLHLLTHRLEAIDGDYVVLQAGVVRTPRPSRPPAGLFDRLRGQRRVIGALIIRETRTRFADAKLGYGWALIEPILHIGLLSATFAALMHGQPPIGGHFFLFYYTGLIPYHVFVHASSGMSHAIIGNAPLLQLPPVTTFDVIAARGLLEVMTDLVVAAILLLGFAALGIANAPDNLWGPAMALLATAAFGCGCGYVNAVMTVFWRSWDKAYSQAMRVLYFVSGIFYVPGMMPGWIRDILWWNPLMHAIDWFRAGFFVGYQPHWLDRSYLALLAILALLGGLGLERGLRRRLSEPL